MGPKGSQPVKLPMYEARELVRAGKLEQAADIYGSIVSGTSENDADERLASVTDKSTSPVAPGVPPGLLLDD